MSKLRSRDIEREAEKIRADLEELHNQLVEQKESAWIPVPCIGMQADPDLKEIRLVIRIGSDRQ